MKKNIKCSEVCAVWDRYDRDCDVYGSVHPVPRTCPLFRQQDREIWEKLFGKNKEMKEDGDKQ